MNDHESMRNAMLTAEPDALRGIGTTELAVHLRDCARCRADAERILAATSSFGAHLDALARTRKSARVPVSWPVWIAVPLAAAIASVMIAQHAIENDQQTVPRVGLLNDVKQPVRVPVVNAPLNRNVAVIQATDNIVVVWDLGAKGGT